MTIVHRRQPTQWSCGVACAAMLSGSTVEDAMKRLPAVRVSAHRRKLKRDYVNVGELRRLVEPHDVVVGLRVRGVPSDHQTAVLRIPNHRKTGWHWCVWAGGMVHDPMSDAPVQAEAYEPIRQAEVSYYPTGSNTTGATRKVL